MITTAEARRVQERRGAVAGMKMDRVFTNRDRFFFILLTLGIWVVAQLWVLGLPLWLLGLIVGR